MSHSSTLFSQPDGCGNHAPDRSQGFYRARGYEELIFTVRVSNLHLQFSIIKKKEEWGIMMDKKIAKEKENKTLRFKVVSAVVVLVTVISIVSGSLSAYFSYESTQKCLQKSMLATTKSTSQIVSR